VTRRNPRDWWNDEAFMDRLFQAHDGAAEAVSAWLREQGVVGTLAGRLTGTIVPWGLPPARSPIEELFYVAASGPAFMLDVNITHEASGFDPYLPDFVLYRVSPRPDGEGWDEAELIVELDGHQFHEKTPEQAEHDKRRDRWFTARGHRVVRFTGREVWRDVHACVAEALEFFPPIDDPTEG